MLFLALAFSLNNEGMTFCVLPEQEVDWKKREKKNKKNIIALLRGNCGRKCEFHTVIPNYGIKSSLRKTNFMIQLRQH